MYACRQTTSLRRNLLCLTCCATWLAAGDLLAATFTWAGTSPNDWFNTNNWSPAGLPGPGDTVDFSSGTINFTSPLTFVGQFNWSGGTLSGSPLTIGTNGIMTVSGGSTKYLYNALTNAGTVTWTGTGNLEVDYSSANSQFGRIENLAGGLWEIQSDRTMLNRSPNGAFFRNGGTVMKSGGTSTTSIAIPFRNLGLVTNLQGTLEFKGGGTIEGTFAAAAGAKINFSTASFDYDTTPTLIGPGTIQLLSGSLTFVTNIIPNLQIAGGTITLGPDFQGGSITNLSMLGGTLNGDNLVSGNLTVAGTLPGSLALLGGATVNWNGGTISGPVNIAAGATLNMVGNTVKRLYNALTNAGTVTWSGNGNLEVDYSSASSQFGLIHNLTGGLWDIQNDRTMANSAANGAYFQNDGRLQKSGGSGTTSISIPFYNSGTVTNLAGTLAFKGGGTIESLFMAAAGSVINFNSGDFTYETLPTLIGPGTIEMTGGALTLDANTIPNLQLAGGTVTLGGNFQGGTVTNLTITGGILSGDLTVSGVFSSGATLPGSVTVVSGATMNWSGGSISGPVNVMPGGTLNITGSAVKLLWNALTNAGTVTWSGSGNLEVDYSSAASQFGLVQNLAGALWDIQNHSTLFNKAPNGAYFQNAGTLQKSADTGAASVSIPLINSGTVTCLAGTLNFKGGGTIEGGFTTAAGATVNFNAGAFYYTSPPTIPGSGTVQLTGGSLTLLNDTIPNLQLAGGTVSLSPAFQGGSIADLTLLGGTLTGNNIVRGTLNSAATLPGSLTLLNGAAANWSGGSIAGPVNVQSGATLNIGGDSTKYLWNALTNAGTVTWSGGGRLQVDYSSAKSQYGLIQNLPGALWDIKNSQNLLNGSPNGAYFQNGGTLLKSADSGITTISIPFFNSGVVTNLVGTIAFKGGGTIDGFFMADAGATINFNAGGFSFSTPPTLVGPGTFQITGGSLTLADDVVPNLELAGGTITLGPGFQGGTVTNLTLSGGTLNGDTVVSGLFSSAATLPGSLTLLDGATADWSGGSISGPVTIAAGATLNIVGSTTKSLWNALTNAGTVIWSGTGDLAVDYSTAANKYGLIQNLAGALWEIQNGQNLLNKYPNSAYFQNAGTVRKSSGKDTTISIPFSNSGTTEASEGTVAFKGGVSLAGGTLVNGLGASTGYGQFSITGDATLAGALNVVLVDGFAPALSNTFTLVKYGARSGTFSPLNTPAAVQWQASYGATEFTLAVSGINKLAILSGPTGTNAGAILAPLIVQVRDASSDAAVPTNGLPVTVALASGTGNISGTITKTTDAAGQVTFDDLSIDLVGNKTLYVFAPATTPATNAALTITPASPARLGIIMPVSARQQDGGVFQPSPEVQVFDAFGNVVPASTAAITAHSSSSGGGSLGGMLTAEANGTTGSASFSNLYYLLGDKSSSETVIIYFTSPGLTPVTNSAVQVNFVFGAITLQSGNSIVRIEPRTPQGMYGWTVDGVEQLYQQWFWLRRGSTGSQVSFDALGSPTGGSLSSSNATIDYVSPGLTTTVTFALHGGVPGSAASDLAQALTLQNTSNGPVTLHVFQYSDFDLSQGADEDVVTFPNAGTVVQSGSSATLTENVVGPVPDYYEGSFYALTFNKIAGSSPATLSDTITPPLAGDQTFAFQWEVTLASGQTVMINFTQQIQMNNSVPANIALNVALAGTNVVVRWPTNGTSGFQLQSAGALSGSWSNVAGLPTTAGTNYEVVLPRTGAAQFYRLQH